MQTHLIHIVKPSHSGTTIVIFRETQLGGRKRSRRFWRERPRRVWRERQRRFWRDRKRRVWRERQRRVWRERQRQRTQRYI